MNRAGFSALFFIVLSVINLFWNTISYATQVSDSLTKVLSGLEDNEHKISVLNDLALEFRDTDPDKALFYSRQALSIATRLQSITSCAVTNKVMGEIFEYKHNYQPSINYYLISIKHYKSLDDKNELARIYNKLGHIYITNQYDYDQGMAYIQTAFEYAEQAGNRKELAASLNSLGGICYYRNELDKAFDYFKDALKIREEIGDQSGIAASLNNVGEIHRLKGDFSKALDYYQQAIGINQEIHQDKYLSINYLNLGLIYASRKNNEKALDYFHKSIELNKKQNDTASMIKGMVEMGNFFNKNEQFDEALKVFPEVLELSEKFNELNGQRDAHLGMSIAFDGKGNVRRAFDAYKQYTNLHDSLFLKAKADQMDEMHSRFAVNLKEKEIALKDNEIALLQQEKNLSQTRQLLLALSLLVGIMVMVLVYTNQQAKHRKNKLMMEQEAALSKARQDLMEIELRNKSNDLTNVALHLIEKNKFLHELKQELRSLKDVPLAQREERIKELTINVQQNINLQKDLQEFQSHIDEVNTSFYRKLKARFPTLTKNEEHLCAMLRLDLSSKEIASLNNITIRAVEMGRYRLRKKFELPSHISISDFLREL